MSQEKQEPPHAVEGLPIENPRVAGIDVGSKQHWVCAPGPEGSGRQRQAFGATTAELEKLAVWLKQRGVESVAMESTGVYWIPLDEILEREGFQVLLVNTRELARVPGRKKTDAEDCQWIQRLHSCGLLRGSFRPSESICMLRTLVRGKAVLSEQRADLVRRMQKDLDQMNVRVHRAVSDLQGATGMGIVRAIANGERDPAKLARLRDPGCRKSEQEIAEQLRGNWRQDHLFSLEQNLLLYDAVGERLEAYEQQILKLLKQMEREDCPEAAAPQPKNANKGKMIRQRGQEPMRQALFRMSGEDLTAIDGVGVGVMETMLSEYGPDLSRFPSEDEFVSHVLLAPRRPVTGGQVMKRKKKPGTGTTRVREALEAAAQALAHSPTAVGAYYRHVARTKGPGIAGFATARKLAKLIYRMLRYGTRYVDEGAERAEQRYREMRLSWLKNTAANLGYTLAPLEAAS